MKYSSCIETTSDLNNYKKVQKLILSKCRNWYKKIKQEIFTHPMLSKLEPTILILLTKKIKKKSKYHHIKIKNQIVIIMMKILMIILEVNQNKKSLVLQLIFLILKNQILDYFSKNSEIQKNNNKITFF